MNVVLLRLAVPVAALIVAAPLQAAPDQPATHRSAQERHSARRHQPRRQEVSRKQVRRRAVRRPTPADAFDGYWSVLVVTQQGNCDRAYRWGVGIVGNRITDVGGAVAQVSGSISPSGRIDARFTSGSDVLTASGTLSGKWGTGMWNSPTQACSGRWRAEKRNPPGSASAPAA